MEQTNLLSIILGCLQETMWGEGRGYPWDFSSLNPQFCGERTAKQQEKYFQPIKGLLHIICIVHLVYLSQIRSL